MSGRRVERREAPAIGAVILADVSASMDIRDGHEWGPRRIERLAEVLDYVLTRHRVQALIGFSDFPVEISIVGRVVLPEPNGSTALDLALEHVAGLVPRPARLIVISDGVPNSPEAALWRAAKLLPTVIDAYYVGPDLNGEAQRFMADLARQSGGRSGQFDLLDPTLLGAEVAGRLRLTGPVDGQRR